MRLTIDIGLDNAAFVDDPHELHAVLTRMVRNIGLRDTADVYRAGASGTVLDSNGNTVGTWSVGDPAPPIDRTALMRGFSDVLANLSNAGPAGRTVYVDEVLPHLVDVVANLGGTTPREV